MSWSSHVRDQHEITLDDENGPIRFAATSLENDVAKFVFMIFVFGGKRLMVRRLRKIMEHIVPPRNPRCGSLR